MAWSARQAGELDRGLALARVAYAEAPDDAGCCFLLCILLLELKDPEANGLLGALERFPGYGPGWDELGRSLTARHPAAARSAFERAAQGYAAMEAAMPSAELGLRLGRVLRQLDDLPGARRAMERATRRDPTSAQAWFALGLVRQDLGEPQEAVEAFRAALAARPGFHEAAFNLGVALQETGALGAALDAYARAWRLRPDSFGRIAQALTSPAAGRLWLHPSGLRRELAARA